MRNTRVKSLGVATHSHIQHCETQKTGPCLMNKKQTCKIERTKRATHKKRKSRKIHQNLQLLLCLAHTSNCHLYIIIPSTAPLPNSQLNIKLHE